MKSSLPSWNLGKLSDIAEIVMGQSPSGDTCNKSQKGIPLLNGPAEFDFHHPNPVQYTIDPKKIAIPEDLLFCVRGSTTGRMNWAEQKYAIGRGIAAIRHKYGNQYKHFIRGVLDIKLPVLLSGATGSTFPNVSKEQLSNLPIPLPPLNEQKAIAHILGSLDDKIELNNKMNQTLEAIAQAIFKSWFVDFDPVRAKMDGQQPVGMDAATAELFPASFEDSELGKIPKGWEVLALKDVCESIFSGGTPRTQNIEYWNGNISWLSSGETRNKFIISSERTITPLGVQHSSTRLASTRSTVIASAGQGNTRGQTSLLMIDTYINQSTIALVANKTIISDLFLFFDLSRRYNEFRQISDSHSSRGSLTTKLLAEVKIISPKFNQIVAFDRIIDPILQNIYLNLVENTTLSTLRDTLLPKLMSGEIRVAEAEKQVENVL